MDDMQVPPLYKYLDLNGAKATLKNQTFKWTKPSDFKAKFKDDMDMTISQLFPEDEPLEIIKNNFTNTPDNYIEHIRNKNQQITNAINSFMQGYRVFCASKNNLSAQMWEDYAENNKGIVLRIEASKNPKKDSIFKTFKPVSYFNERPTFFKSALEYLTASSITTMNSLTIKAINHTIYSKAPISKYSYESEYRCVWPLLPQEEHLSDLFQKFHSEEIAGLYLGKNISPTNRNLFIRMAKNINPAISIYQLEELEKTKLTAKKL